MSTQLPSFYSALRGVWTLTWRTRLTFKKLLPLLANVFAIPIFASFVLDSGDTRGYYHFLIDLYFTLVLPITCLSHFGAMIRDELQEDTMTFLITRPVSRGRILILKYLTLVIWIQLILFGNCLGFWLLGQSVGVPETTGLIIRLMQVQVMAVFAYGALSTLFGLLSQKYLILGVVYGFLVEFGISQIPTNINLLSLSKHFKTLLAKHQPLADFFNWSAEGAGSSFWFVIAGTLIFLGASAAMFTLREYHHAEEMQKGS